MRRFRRTGPWTCSTRSASPTGAGVPAGRSPTAQKRALELALALALDPRVLLLDEPTAGMGLEDVDRTIELVEAGRQRAHRGDGRPQHERRRLARRPGDRAAVRAVLVEGPYEQVRADERVITAYLGSRRVAEHRG